jgi:bifunctional polynucleotide phosphatase/kinase
MSWESLDTTLVRIVSKHSSHEKYPNKVAMFDLDGTLITTRSGKKFPEGISDWKWLNKKIIPTLKKLSQEGYAIVIITNQAGASKNAISKSEILERVENVFKELLDECEPKYAEVYIAMANDVYRKPNTSIFEKYIWPSLEPSPNTLTEKGSNIHIFYVGDAAGRENDFSDSDRKFAFNMHLFLKNKLERNSPGVKFYTPEEYFQNRKAEPETWTGLDPRKYFEKAKQEENTAIQQIDELAQTTRLVLVMVGPPAAGKSTLSDKLMQKYPDQCYYVNQDTCRSKDKCLREYAQGLQWMETSKNLPRIIIVDNTNPNSEAREPYVRKAAAYPDIKVEYILFDESRELYEHMNIYRERLYFHKNLPTKRIPAVVYHKYYKNFEPPPEEDTITIDWSPTFHNKYEILMFMQRS